MASLWYLIVSTILSIGQFYVERHFARGALRTQPHSHSRLRRDLRVSLRSSARSVVCRLEHAHDGANGGGDRSSQVLRRVEVLKGVNLTWHGAK